MRRLKLHPSKKNIRLLETETYVFSRLFAEELESGCLLTFKNIVTFIENYRLVPVYKEGCGNVTGWTIEDRDLFTVH